MCCSTRIVALVAGGLSGLALLLTQANAQQAKLPASVGHPETGVCNPQGNLTVSGSVLYGMSAYGGAKNRGAIFSLPAQGGNLTILASFDGSNGAQPWGSLTLRGSTLYGMTSLGGEHDKGTVFSVPVGGGTVTTLASFDGTNGANPWGNLTLSADGSTLYGMTELGGVKNLGAIFSLPLRGGSPTVLASFEGNNGAQPQGSLILRGSTLYGMTGRGGAQGQGAIFTISTGGGTVTVLASFEAGNGQAAMGSLTLGRSILYGMTWVGGAHGRGTVFSVPVGGGTITVLASFDGSNGAQPTGSLTLSDGNLYGITDRGGANDKGTLFRIPVGGGALTTLVSFSERDRAYHRRTLTLSPDGSTLYGMTTPGGACVPGTLFSMTTHALPSRPSTIDEFIKPTPSPSWQTNVAALKRVIRKTVKPKAIEQKPLPAAVEALLAWSRPVNGLVARIEYVWGQTVFFVRLRNVSDHPVVVPAGNSSSGKAGKLFDVHVQQGSSAWRRVTNAGEYDRYFPAPPEPETQTGDSNRQRDSERQRAERQPADRPWVTLQPGTSCIALAAGADEEDTGEVKKRKSRPPPTRHPHGHEMEWHIGNAGAGDGAVPARRDGLPCGVTVS